MKLLLLIPQNVIPPTDGGKTGIYMPMKMLAEQHVVKAIVFCGVGENVNIDEYSKLNVDVILTPVNKKDTAYLIATNITTKLPFKFKKYYNARYKKIIENICETWMPDAIICHHAHLAEYCYGLKVKFPAIKLILREHNLEYLLVQQYYKIQKNTISRLVAFWQYKKTEKAEKKTWEYFDDVVLISDSDFKHAPQSTKSKVHIIYDGTNNIADVGIPHQKNKAFLFTGSVTSYQNRFNLHTFINTIWIPWKQQFEASAGYELWITGDKDAKKASDLLQLADGKAENYNIKILGFADNISMLMRRSAFFLSPTLVGAGIRIKVLEALGLGCVIFLTKKDTEMASAIADGFNVVMYEDLLTFNKKAEMLTNDPELYKRLSTQAAITAQENFTWNIFYKKLNSLIEYAC